MNERINPIKYTDRDTGDVYTLDFNRESIRFAEARGFNLEDVGKYPSTGIGNLFYFAFRAKHKSVSKEKAEKLLDKVGGLTEDALHRLISLYNQAATANLIQDEEELEKNEHAALEL